MCKVEVNNLYIDIAYHFIEEDILVLFDIDPEEVGNPDKHEAFTDFNVYYYSTKLDNFVSRDYFNKKRYSVETNKVTYIGKSLEEAMEDSKVINPIDMMKISLNEIKGGDIYEVV